MYPEESVNEYIRNILGYPNNNNLYINDNQLEYLSQKDQSNQELEKYYPNIYKKVYPIICQKCKNLTEDITEETIDKMVDEIYNTVNIDNEIEININLQNSSINNIRENRNTTNNRNFVEPRTSRNRTSTEPRIENRNLSRTSAKKEEIQEDRENRIARDSSLQDLIKILILRELLGRPGGNRPRPPYLGGPQRPPYPRNTNRMQYTDEFGTLPFPRF